MRVLFTFLTFGTDIFAGMENSLFNLIKGLRLNGHEVAVFTSVTYGTSDSVEGIPVHRSRHLPTQFSGGDDAIEQSIRSNQNVILKDILRTLDRFHPDIIVAWDPLWGFIQLLDMPRHIPKILVFKVINNDRMLRLAEECPYSARFAVSPYLRDALRRHGVYAHLDILPNSIDLDWIMAERKRTPKQKIILCNARLSPEKGVEYAIRGFAEFLECEPSYRLQLCSGTFPFGDLSSTRDQVERLLRSMAIECSVDILPNLSWKDIPRTIATAHAVVLPTLMESFGQAALEALAAGTPVVASRVGNLPDLLSGHGVLVTPRSPEEICAALVRLTHDSTLYTACQDGGILHARQYRHVDVASRFIDSVTRCINSP